ncbi:hypothetical protein DH2020_016118 [Rehmannia glutinosa]|uniref:Uncharacterized protein n=1 Tax=Rehmannia glutinosa TaxID=99300 RepID=A0ABR0WX61_REHGL
MSCILVKHEQVVRNWHRLLERVNASIRDNKRRRQEAPPRQFEYHPSDSSLMAVGTLDGEVVVLNHETGNIVSCISPYGNMNSILGLCWLKQQPSSQNWKMATATLTVIFDDFEQLTSVHVNSSDDRCLTSGYSKKVAIYDICSGQRLQLFTDMHREPINVKQLLSVDGRLHTDFGIVSTGSAHNYTRSYYMNGRDYIISGSCEEPIIRVCCAQTGRRLRDISLEDTRWELDFCAVLRSDPFRHFDMAASPGSLRRPTSKYEIIKVNLLSSSHSDEENQGGLNICNSYCKGG